MMPGTLCRAVSGYRSCATKEHLQRLREALITRALARSISVTLKLFDPSVRGHRGIMFRLVMRFKDLHAFGTGGRQALDTDLAG
jgi:hypothetical protein